MPAHSPKARTMMNLASHKETNRCFGEDSIALYLLDLQLSPQNYKPRSGVPSTYPIEDFFAAAGSITIHHSPLA